MFDIDQAVTRIRARRDYLRSYAGQHANVELGGRAEGLNEALTLIKEAGYRPAQPLAVTPGGPVLSTHEVAQLFRVCNRTVVKWAGSGRLPSFRTMGGHLRFKEEDVVTLFNRAGPGRRRD